MVSDERVIRVLRLLQGAIRAAGYTQTEMDDRIGRRRGYLSHVFQRRVDLKLQDLLQTLEAMQIDAGSFFLTALKSQARPQLDDLIELVTTAKLTETSWPASFPEPPSAEVRSTAESAGDPDAELLERVRAIVRQVLASLPHRDTQSTG